MRTYILAIAAFLFGGFSVQAQLAKPAAAVPKRPLGVPVDAKHFNGKWYRVYVGEVKSWSGAKERALAVGGQLACAADAPTHAFLAELASNRTLWIGGTRRAEALWYWVNGAQFSFTAWGPGQPDATRGEDWLVLHGGRWHDNNGRGQIPIVGFIAEWPK